MTSITPLITSACVPYDEPESDLGIALNRKQQKILDQKRIKHERTVTESCKEFADNIISQWPTVEPKIVGTVETPLLDVEIAWQMLKPEWELLVRSYRVTQFVKQIQSILTVCIGSSEALPGIRHGLERTVFSIMSATKVVPLIDDLISRAAAMPLPDRPSAHLVPAEPLQFQKQSERELVELCRAVDIFRWSTDMTRSTYGHDLYKSIESLRTVSKVEMSTNVDRMLLPNMILELRVAMQKALNAIRESISAGSGLTWLNSAGLLPKLSPTVILSSIRGSAAAKNPLRSAIIQYCSYDHRSPATDQN